MPSQVGTHSNRRYAVGLARAFSGAILFAFPLLMTMEMWWIGFHIDSLRLLLFIGVAFLVVLGLSWFAGFEPTLSFRDCAADAFAAYGLGILASAVVLFLFNVLNWGSSLDELVGKVAIQSAPAGIGAVVASKQLGARGEENDQNEKEGRAGYPGQLFLMIAGALFLAFNVAPTEEMILIAFKMTPWHALALGLVSLGMLHGLVYTVGFAGQEPRGSSFWATLGVYSIPGYAIALAVSLYLLWTFGRVEGADPSQIAVMTVVLGFPAALGATLARLVV